MTTSNKSDSLQRPEGRGFSPTLLMKYEDLRKTYPEFVINYRLDGRIEVVCPDNGVGHTISIPDYVPKEEGIHISETREALFIHGCDGCCSKERFKEFAKKFLEQRNRRIIKVKK